jgi:RNA polymerase sigma factor for flagellar operon FliA
MAQGLLMPSTTEVQKMAPDTLKTCSDRSKPGVRRPPTAEEAALVRQYAPVVHQIAGGFQRRLPRSVLRDDLVAAGMCGLWDAIRKHGHNKSERFDWYVRVRVRGAILDELRAQDWLPRRVRAAATQAAKAAPTSQRTVPAVVRFDEISESEQAHCLASCDPNGGDVGLENRESAQALVHAVERLPERERDIVALYYFKGVKFKELGRLFGVSEPRISQLHSRAMTRLKVMLEQAA